MVGLARLGRVARVGVPHPDEPDRAVAGPVEPAGQRGRAGRAADKPVRAGSAVSRRAGGHRDPYDAGGVVALTEQQPTGLRLRLRWRDAGGNGGVGVAADAHLVALALVDEHVVGVPGEMHGRPVTAVQAGVGKRNQVGGGGFGVQVAAEQRQQGAGERYRVGC